MQSAAQSAVDRSDEFNQTFQHDHREGVICPCGHGDNVAATERHCMHCGKILTDGQTVRCDVHERLYRNSYDTTALHEAFYPPAPAEASERGHLARPAFDKLKPGASAYVPTHAAARIDDLEEKLRTERNLHAITADRLRVAMDRISGFETMVQSLSEHVDRLMKEADELKADLIFHDETPDLSPETAHDLRADGSSRGFLCSQPGHFGPCMLPYNHAGPCDSGEPLKAA